MKTTIFLFMILCLQISAVGQQPIVLDGFSPESSSKQSEIEAQLEQMISPNKIEDQLQWLTSRPHRAGTEGAKVTAEYLQKQLQEYGFQTELVRYEAYLPAPVSVSIELLQPVQWTLPSFEAVIENDRFTDRAKDHPGWNGYSPSGEATGMIVYAHHGSEADFQHLKKLGIDLRGKILLMRYFGTGEGAKVRNAQNAGAAGVVLYSDPAEDGYRYGNVYPKGNWRPPESIMRRTIVDLPYEGDPLSPGFASVAGSNRLKPEQVDLPRIPVLPISYQSAENVLRHLDGPVAPYEWQGALGLTYKIGPGPATVRIKTEMDNRDRPIWNVVARFPGKEDQWIIVGNHHDAWIYGAGDPSSGTASLLELARALGQLKKQGYVPRRTLILAFWDAEEMMLGGSTEWVEHHQEELLEKAVACINMDSSVFNPDRPLSVSAHPVLHNLFRGVSRNVADPRSGRSTFDVWRDMQNQFRKVPSVDGWGGYFDPEKTLTAPHVFERPFDDAQPFFDYLALPSSDMYYGADYGMYHSIYENFHWMKTVVDPTFGYHKVMSLMQGFAALRLANADFIPLDFAEEAVYWRLAYENINGAAKETGAAFAGFEEALKLTQEWEREARDLVEAERNLMSDSARWQAAQPNLQEWNRDIFRLARNFYRPSGMPGLPTLRNLFTGDLTGIRIYLEQKKTKEMEAEANAYRDAIQQRIGALRSIRQKLEALK